MDSSVSPTHGERESSAWNGHYACTCYHPLFVFNQFGDLERCSLRPGNVHSADGWDAVLKPVVARYQGKVSRIYFRADAGFVSGRKLDAAAPRHRQSGMASWRALSARRVHRHQHVEIQRECRFLLQQARNMRAVDQGRQKRDQVAAAVVPDVRVQRGAAPASCARTM
jgi:Transposase DDE domain group 1